MRTLLLLAMFLFASPALADTVTVPLACERVIDTKISTGGGESAAYYLSITCEGKDGVVLYNVIRTTVMGWLGAGRWAIPHTIRIVRKDVKEPRWD